MIRKIASGEGDPGVFGGVEEAVEELVGPALGQLGGHGKGKKGGEGLAAHGRNVRESAGEAAVTDGVGGMPLAAEVDAFEGKIGSDQGLSTGEGGEHGAIVSDGLENAGRGGAALGGAGRLAGVSDAFDETNFRNRHDGTEYSKRRVRESGQRRRSGQGWFRAKRNRGAALRSG